MGLLTGGLPGSRDRGFPGQAQAAPRASDRHVPRPSEPGRGLRLPAGKSVPFNHAGHSRSLPRAWPHCPEGPAAGVSDMPRCPKQVQNH